MALLTTYNGWVQATPAQLARVQVGDLSAQVRAGDVAVVLGAFLADFAREVEPIERLYGWRSIATNAEVGGDPRSTHLSGTAVDVNGHRHPWEKRTGTARYPARGGFTTAQLAALRKVLARYDGAIAWGGDYPRGIRDAMHFDIRAGAATVADLAARLSPAATPIQEDTMRMIRRGRSGTTVLVDAGVATPLTDTERTAWLEAGVPFTVLGDDLFDAAVGSLAKAPLWWDVTVGRDGREIPVIQEVADAKTLAAQAVQLLKAQGKVAAGVDVDALAAELAKALAPALAAAVRDGIDGARITTSP